VWCQLSVSSDASDVINSVQYDSGTANDYSFNRAGNWWCLERFSDKNITVGCYCIIKVHSNYGNFKMLAELVLRGPDDDGDFEVRSCPQRAFLVFWD